MGGPRFREGRKKGLYMSPSRVLLTETNKNGLKPQCAKFSLVALPEGWGGELCGGCQEQNLQDLGPCHYLALRISGKTFWCIYLLHTRSVLKILKHCHACVAFLMNWCV